MNKLEQKEEIKKQENGSDLGSSNCCSSSLLIAPVMVEVKETQDVEEVNSKLKQDDWTYLSTRVSGKKFKHLLGRWEIKPPASHRLRQGVVDQSLGSKPV